MAIRLEPLAETFGAVVHGIDIADVTDETFAEVEAALHEHSILLFRNQHPTPAQSTAFMARFGHMAIPPRVRFNLPEEPRIAVLGNATENGEQVGFQHAFGVEWHVDGTGKPEQQVVTALHAIEVPESGGDTLYSGSYLAAAELPEDLRARIEGRIAVYNYRRIHDKLSAKSAQGSSMAELAASERPDTRHAILRPHPRTGREALYVTPEEMIHIEGLGEAESYALAMEVIAHATQDRYTYRHKWSVGDYMIHDNSGSLHSTTEYTYQDQRRRMHRLIAAA